MSAMVEMIIAKCEDEKGDKVFTLEDKPILLNETCRYYREGLWWRLFG